MPGSKPRTERLGTWDCQTPLKSQDIEPNDISCVFGTPSIFFVKGWSVLDVCVEGKSICLVSPLGGFEDCKYQSQQTMVLLIKIAHVLLTWASK